MRRVLLLLCLFASTLTAAEYPPIPDSTMSPGELCTEDNPDFKELRYGEKIPYCTRNVSYEQRQAIYDAYGIPKEDRKQYTIDHLLPLSIGGSNHPRNLWPEHQEVKKSRANFETELYRRISTGAITQEQAVRETLELKFKSQFVAW